MTETRRHLTDLIALVRHALQPDTELIPYPEQVRALFHEVDLDDFLIIFRDNETAQTLLSEPRLQRAISVIYRPQTERVSHYFFAELPDQFDALFYFDETEALEPLEPTSEWVEDEAILEELIGEP